MKTIDALALINDIREEIDENGFQTNMVVQQLKELRGYALEEGNPVATKALRLAYEHIALHQEFAIEYVGEEDEDEDEDEEENADVSKEESTDAPKEEGETVEGEESVDPPKEAVEAVEEEEEEDTDNFAYFMELIRAAENRFNRAELLDIIKLLQEYE